MPVVVFSPPLPSGGSFPEQGMVRAAIVGLGRWGRSLVSSVQGKSEDIRFVLAHTRTRSSAEAFCREAGVPLTDSYATIVADPSVDAVVLATPHSQHEAQVLQAIAAGKHVFVEKPITLTRASADAVVEAARQAGIVLAVGFYAPLQSGDRRGADAARRWTAGPARRHGRAAYDQHRPFHRAGELAGRPADSPGGALTAVGVHLLDHMIEFGGRVRDVLCATKLYGAGPADDTTTILLRFAGGVTGTIFCSVATATNFSFTVYGTKALAEVSRPNLQRFRFVPGIGACADRSGDGAARRDHRAPEIRYAQRRAHHVRPLHKRAHDLSGRPRRRAARHVGIRRRGPLGGKRKNRNRLNSETTAQELPWTS